jgi:selenobiotic family peptide radical SAM maturase
MNFENDLIAHYGGCCREIGLEKWETVFSRYSNVDGHASFPVFLAEQIGAMQLPAFIGDLAQLEEAYSQVRFGQEIPLVSANSLIVNPTLQLLQLHWKNLVPLLMPEKFSKSSRPINGEELILIWKDPTSLVTRMKPASRQELLVLKILVEDMEWHKAAKEGNSSIGQVDAAFAHARRMGIVLSPPSKLKRPGKKFSRLEELEENNLTADVFTLQWHITQMCDLHCKHCYDRSKRSSLKLQQGLAILDQLRDFTQSRNVAGQVTFTGGNPLLYPHFLDLYRGAAEREFSVAVLGNPSSEEQLQQLLNIREPVFFQVSLEGLPIHNDAIRGKGHFQRTMKFLELLKKLKISSMIMLTLTSENIDQIIPLAEYLRDKVDDFFFNRLSPVGEGACLQLPSSEKYQRFLTDYLLAAKDNPVMGLKDNLINIIKKRENKKLFGGCCGFGCGAAFNFFSVLADGEVHACRKFPSPIGNVYKQTVAEIYDSSEAEKYRQGCDECSECSLKPQCGGCLAISNGYGLDIFKQRDPFCFIG